MVLKAGSVTHIEDAATIWVQWDTTAEEKESAEALARGIETFVARQADPELLLDSETAKKGTFCFAPFESEGWYRGQIQSISSLEGTATVFFLDHGNSASIPISRLRTIDPEYLKILVRTRANWHFSGFQSWKATMAAIAPSSSPT